MQFGQVEHPENVDFSLPKDHKDTKKILSKYKKKDAFEVFVGCAKWNRTELKGFYPRGTKDELAYYSTQFNSIELNATFYKTPDWQQVETWREKTPHNFKFFPKISQTVTHYKRLNDVQEPIADFCNSVSNFGDKLGMSFLQLPENFKPKDFEKLKNALELFPKNFPLAVEVRNPEWFSDEKINDQFCAVLQNLNMANIIVDTAGRRDMLHMRLTSDVAFVRYVGANHSSDKDRLDDWVEKIKKWKAEGLQKLYFFVHQNIELESPLLAAYFIEKLNEAIGTSLKIPNKKEDNNTLF